MNIEGFDVSFISYNDLILSKKAVLRDKDIDDTNQLNSINQLSDNKQDLNISSNDIIREVSNNIHGLKTQVNPNERNNNRNEGMSMI